MQLLAAFTRLVADFPPRCFRWLMNQFIKADKDKSGELDFNEVLHVLDLMNIKLTRCYAYEIFMVTPALFVHFELIE